MSILKSDPSAAVQISYYRRDPIGAAPSPRFVKDREVTPMTATQGSWGHPMVPMISPLPLS